MKILHLATHIEIGGITSHLATLSKGLRLRGHDVWIGSSGGALEDRFTAQGVPTVRLPVRTKSEAHPKLALACWRLAALCRQERFDLLHAHTRVTQVLARLVSKLTGIPVVTTAHGFYRPKWFRRVFACWGDRVIAVSPLAADALKDAHGVEASRITVIYNGLDTERFTRDLLSLRPLEIRQRLEIPPKALVLGAVSRLVEDKGHSYLIEAARLLKDEGIPVYVLIVGDGRERERIRSLVREKGLEGSVRLLPGTQNLAELYSIMDLFVHPATYKEGFGLSLAEAMLALKPVVVTNIEAVNAFIRDEVNGLIVPPKDAGALAEAVRRLTNDPLLAARLSENGRESVLEVCSLERMAAETEHVYRKVLLERASPVRGV